ncbi:MAG: DUF952 domain-containing protein [Alphaproteobacteria bacterium]
MEPSEQAWVYKILRAREWQAFRETGVFAGSADDLRDGFIHLSARDQVEGTRAKYFAAEPDIVILRASATQLGSELRWEPSRGGVLFPHLYRPLRLDEVEVCAAV